VSPGPVVHLVQYDTADAELRRGFAMLLRRVYAPANPLDPPRPDHHPSFDATSFYIADGTHVVSYAAVVRLVIRHAGQRWALAGISAVATAPECRGRGYGTLVVAAATRYILASDADIGLFTCDESLVAFYQRAGWPRVAGIAVVGSGEEGALTSEGLGKAVLLRLLSRRAHASRDAFEDATINLELPPGDFL
jgi:GNAT superfamily N-acetyltransferase